MGTCVRRAFQAVDSAGDWRVLVTFEGGVSQEANGKRSKEGGGLGLSDLDKQGLTESPGRIFQS